MSTADFFLSEWRDLNSRPLDPQSSTLTRLRHTPEMGLGVSVQVKCGCEMSVSVSLGVQVKCECERGANVVKFSEK